jgi:hypothetical protein
VDPLDLQSQKGNNSNVDGVCSLWVVGSTPRAVTSYQGEILKVKLTVLLAVLSLSVSGCTFAGGADQAKNCSIWEDEYFTFLPTSNQMENPYGYFTEAVEAQNAFMARLEGLSSPSAAEGDLIRRLLDATRNLQRAYIDQLGMLLPGQSREEFLSGLSETAIQDWVASGEKLASATQGSMVIFEEYAAFCSEAG